MNTLFWPLFRLDRWSEYARSRQIGLSRRALGGLELLAYFLYLSLCVLFDNTIAVPSWPSLNDSVK